MNSPSRKKPIGVLVVAQITRLRETAAAYRLRAVESQLSLAFTLCELVETLIRYDQPNEAIKLINKVRHHTEVIRLHIDEPNHLPGTAIPHLRERVTQLRNRTEEIESAFRQT